MPPHANEHRVCCRHDPERDNYAYQRLKEVFPKYMFYNIVGSGAIPPRSKAGFAILTGIWIFYSCYLIYKTTITTFLIVVQSRCLFDPNCMPTDPTFSLTALIAMLIGDLSHLLSILLINTYLRDLLRSRELQTLLFSVGPYRIRKPTRYW